MRLPVSFVGAPPRELDLISVRGRARIAGADLVLGDEVERFRGWARPGVDLVEAGAMDGVAVAARLRAAHQAGKAAVRAVNGAVGLSVRALDEIRILLESGALVEVVPSPGQEVIRWPWHERLPLAGRRIAVTRAREQAGELGELLVRLGAEVIEAPAVALAPPDDDAPLDRALDALERYDLLVFTSANAAHRFLDRLFERGRDARACARLCIAAIGPGTAQALCAHGLRADVVPPEHRAEALVEALLPHVRRGTRVLLPRALEAREILPEALVRAGAEVEVVPVYRTVPPPPEALAPLRARLAAGEVHAVVFASASAAKNMVHALGGPSSLSRVAIACIGPVTAQSCVELGLTVAVQPPSATIEALAEALCASFGRSVG